MRAGAFIGQESGVFVEDGRMVLEFSAEESYWGINLPFLLQLLVLGVY